MPTNFWNPGYLLKNLFYFTTSKNSSPHFVNKDWSEKLITSLNWSCGTALGLLPSTIDRNPMPKAKSFNFSAKNLIGFSHFFRIFFILFHSFLSLKFLLTGSLIIAFIDWHINLKIEWKYYTYICTIFNIDIRLGK